MSLTAKELKRFDENVGATSTIVASGIARLHLASPDPKKMKGKFSADSILNQFPKLSKTDWTYADVVGGLVLVVDRAMDTMVFQIYNLETNDIRFEYELYEDIKYNALNNKFHCFEMEDCVAGFDFSSDEVAQRFFSKVNALKPKVQDLKKKKKGGKKKKDKRAKKKTRGGKKNKFVVGEVMDVTHVGHIGNDGTGGFDLSQIPKEWKEMFKQAGIRKKDLKNAETAQAVIAAIQEEEMNQHYQAQPEYENFTQDDLEKMYTPEHREQYQAYQEEMKKYEDEIEAFRQEQEQLDQWQRENADLINAYTDGAPVAPPRMDLMKEQPPIAPPRVDRVTEVAPVAPPRVQQPVEPVRSRQPPPVQSREPPPQENSFDAEFRRKMEQQAQKPAVTALDIEQKINQGRAPPPKRAAPAEPKYNLDKLNALEREMKVTETKKLRDNKITKNIYDRSAQEEDSRFEPIVATETAPKSPDVERFEAEMDKAQNAAERARLEAQKLQAERDRIMATIHELEAKKNKNKKDIKKQKKEQAELQLPPLPSKPKLPPPPKLPALPQLDIPLPPPPPPVPTFDMPPPIPAPAPVQSTKRAPKPAPAPVVTAPPKRRAPTPKAAPTPKVAPVIPPTRKVSVAPEPKHAGTPVRPPGMTTPSNLMMDLMKNQQNNLKKAEKPAPKTVRPPPNLMLQQLAAGRGNLRKTENTPKNKKSSVNAGVLKNMKKPVDGKGQNAMMTKLAVTMIEIRQQMGADDSDSDSESDWELD